MNTHFVMDEAGSLGHMPIMEKILNVGRGYGALGQWFYQNMGQLKKNWPSDDGAGLLANTTQIFMGCNDVETAKYLNQRLGQETIWVEDKSDQEGTNWQTSYTGGKGGTSFSRNRTRSQKQMGRDLAKVDEVLRLSPRTAITFCPGGMAPIKTELLRYYEEKWLYNTGGRWNDFRAACRMLIQAMAFLALTGCLALFATRFLQEGGFHGDGRSVQSETIGSSPGGGGGGGTGSSSGRWDGHGRPLRGR